MKLEWISDDPHRDLSGDKYSAASSQKQEPVGGSGGGHFPLEAMPIVGQVWGICHGPLGVLRKFPLLTLSRPPPGNCSSALLETCQTLTHGQERCGVAGYD